MEDRGKGFSKEPHMLNALIANGIDLIRNSEIHIDSIYYCNVGINENGGRIVHIEFAEEIGFNRSVVEVGMLSITSFTFFDAFLENKFQLKDDHFKSRYNTLTNTHAVDKWSRLVYRTLRILRNSFVHSATCCTINNDIISTNLSGKEFIEISKKGLSAILTMAILISTKRNCTPLEYYMNYLHCKAINEISKFQDSLGLLDLNASGIKNKIESTNRNEIDSPEFFIDGDSYIVECVRRNEYERNSYHIIDGGYDMLIPEEIMTHGNRANISKSKEWDAEATRSLII